MTDGQMDPTLAAILGELYLVHRQGAALREHAQGLQAERDDLAGRLAAAEARVAALEAAKTESAGEVFPT